jgi:hypothetical protein
MYCTYLVGAYVLYSEDTLNLLQIQRQACVFFLIEGKRRRIFIIIVIFFNCIREKHHETGPAREKADAGNRLMSQVLYSMYKVARSPAGERRITHYDTLTLRLAK